MKSDSNGLKFRNKTEETVASIIYPIVVKIRKDLMLKYDVFQGEYRNYTGLCDTSVKMLSEELQKYATENNISIECHGIHGEQKHSPRLNSCLWSVQHTWAIVKMMGVTMYVDPTSSQFKRIYHFIPDFYISCRKPRWYYPDSKNPVYNNRITGSINKYIKIPTVKTFNSGKVIRYKAGIIEYFQYEIWGRIADLMHKQERPMIRRL